MRLLYVHDHWFINYGDAVYSRSQFSYSFWLRYLRVFNHICVAGREAYLGPTEGTTSLETSSGPNVQFLLFPNLSTLPAQIAARRHAVEKMRELVNSADAVIARLPSELGLVAASVASELGKPWAAEVAGCGWDALWNYGNWQGKAYAPIMFHRMRRAVAAAPYVLYVTQEFLQRRYPNSKGLTVGCSNVEIERPRREVLGIRLGRVERDARPTVLGLIGTLRTKYKGIQTALEALALCRGELPPVEFRVLGAGDRHPWQVLAKHFGVADITRFEGVLPGGEAVLHWLDKIDLYLQPSFQEGVPRALIEAMSRGCPALGSTCAGIPELLEPDCLIRPGDAKHLAALIVNRISDRVWKAEQAERNWTLAHEYNKYELEARRDNFLAKLAQEAANISTQ